MSWFYLEYCFFCGVQVSLNILLLITFFPNDHWFLLVRILWEGSELPAVFLKESKYSFWRVWKLDFRLRSTLFAVYPQYMWTESSSVLKSWDTGAVSAFQNSKYLGIWSFAEYYLITIHRWVFLGGFWERFLSWDIRRTDLLRFRSQVVYIIVVVCI